VNGLEEAIAKARKADAEVAQILTTQAVCYANLGFASKALSAFRRVVDIQNMNVTVGIHTGVACGAFQRIEELANQAELAKMDLSGIKNLPKWRAAAAAMSHQGVTDDEYARVVDLAGEVIRSRKLLWQDKAPGVVANGLDCPVVLTMRVDVTPTEAAQMSLEFADKMIDADLHLMPLLVAFVGTAQ